MLSILFSEHTLVRLRYRLRQQLRVQLVDLVVSLHWLAFRDPQVTLPDRGVENATLRSSRCDYYYDLSRKETDQLENAVLDYSSISQRNRW